MNRNKFTDFIFDKMKWTGIFLYDQIYGERLSTILDEMKVIVQNNQTVSPTWWINKALQLNILWQDLKNELTKYEMIYKSEIVAEMEEGKTVSGAKLIVESKSENYKTYKYLSGRDSLIKEFILLAKKRATREQDYS